MAKDVPFVNLLTWNEVQKAASNLKHRDRRKLIKKFKRSLKRVAAAKLLSGNILTPDADDTVEDNYFYKPFFIGHFLKELKETSQNESSLDINSSPEEIGAKKQLAVSSKSDALSNLLMQIDVEVKQYTEEPPSPPQAKLTTKDKEWEHDEIVNITNIAQADRCKFFDLVGACRYKENCKKHHVKVESGCVILIESMFTSFGIEMSERAKLSGGCYGDANDIGLEYSEDSVYDEFVDFVEDVVPELQKFGTIINFKVSSNKNAFLRGNVYVEYESCFQASKCLENLNGRFYNGKQLCCRFINILNWTLSICGQYRRHGVCSRGDHCNYIHCFSNPRGLQFGKERFKLAVNSIKSHSSHRKFNRFDQRSPCRLNSRSNKRSSCTSREQSKHKKRKRCSVSRDKKSKSSHKEKSHKSKKSKKKSRKGMSDSDDG